MAEEPKGTELVQVLTLSSFNLFRLGVCYWQKLLLVRKTSAMDQPRSVFWGMEQNRQLRRQKNLQNW